MAPFGIGDRPQAPPLSAPPDTSQTPTQQVVTMRGQGLTNNQIIQSLQREGYRTQQIVDAMNQAENAPAGPVPGAVPPEMAAQPTLATPEGEPFSPPASEGVDHRMEEIAEAIIDEKWNELVKHVNKIIEWKNGVESRMQTVEARFNDLRSSFENMERAVIKKVEDYDQNITDVGTEIKAMEKVFQKVLPELTDNVNKLSQINKKL